MPNNLGEVMQKVREDKAITKKDKIIIANFIAKVKKARRQKGWTLAQLSYISNISVNSIVNIEKGCKRIPKESTIRKIAEALEVEEAKATLEMLEILKHLEETKKKKIIRAKYKATTPLAELVRAERLKRNMSVVEF